MKIEKQVAKKKRKIIYFLICFFFSLKEAGFMTQAHSMSSYKQNDSFVQALHVDKPRKEILTKLAKIKAHPWHGASKGGNDSTLNEKMTVSQTIKDSITLIIIKIFTRPLPK